MKRRDCCEVISNMIKEIPIEKIDLIDALKLNYDDAQYKAPEENIQWNRTMQTLQTHISKPTEEWEFKVLNIFTTKPIEELKKINW